MKNTFMHKLVNGPFEDSSLYLRFRHEKRSLLFDAGDLSALAGREIMKISDLFVSHTHIDHFIGFDRLLRVLLKREKPLRVYGPGRMIEAVENKIWAYTWNRIREYPVNIDVFAIEGGMLRKACFHARDGFRRQDMGEVPFDGVLVDDNQCTAMACVVDHDVESVAYSVEEPLHVNIRKDVLDTMGLAPGPWLRLVKKAVRAKAPGDTAFLANDRRITLDGLGDAVFLSPGEKVSYVTDANPTEENIRKITEFVRGSTTLYCEACFLEKDRAIAEERNHLTGRIAGRIARQGGVHELMPMHLSVRYIHSEHTPAHEALEEFSSQGAV